MAQICAWYLARLSFPQTPAYHTPILCFKWPGRAGTQVSRGIWVVNRREFHAKVWALTRKGLLGGD